jgi:hypothetical protein
MNTVPALLAALRRRPYARLAILSAVAASASYAIGSLLPWVDPVVAAISALISVRPDFHHSAQEAVRQVVGTLLGAGAGILLVLGLGFSPLVLLAALVAGFVAARLMRIGHEGAATVGVTVILVLGLSMDADDIEARFLGVVTGVILAVVVSAFVTSGTPQERALRTVLGTADRLSGLVSRVADGLVEQEVGLAETAAAGSWLREATALHGQASSARHAAEDAVAGSRWSPLVRQQAAREVLLQARLTEATATTVVSMCRDYLDVAADSPLPCPLARPLSEALTATAGAIQARPRGREAVPRRRCTTRMRCSVGCALRDWRPSRTCAAWTTRRRSCWAVRCCATARRSRVFSSPPRPPESAGQVRLSAPCQLCTRLRPAAFAR